MKEHKKRPRKGWQKKFKEMHEEKDDEMVIKDEWMNEECVKNKVGLKDKQSFRNLKGTWSQEDIDTFSDERKKNLEKEEKQDFNPYFGLLDEIDEEKLARAIEEEQEPIKKEEINLAKFLIECGLTSFLDGRCVWINMANREIEVNGDPLQNGSLRLLGQLISAICGGNYMDYYCAREQKSDVERVWKIMEKHGARIIKDGYNCDDLEKDLDSIDGRL